jgi:uncharacterized protein (DUF2236 family)
MWVHIAQVDSFLSAFRAFGAAKLTAAEADGYVHQAGSIAARLGVIEPPRTVMELSEIMESYRPELSGSGGCPTGDQPASGPAPVHGPARAGYHMLAAGAVSTLPEWARVELRLPMLPLPNAS